MLLQEPMDDLAVRGKNPTVAIETRGCKLNQADSAMIASSFLDAGFKVVSTSEGADVYLVNPCTVTHVADGKARQSLRAARRRNPGATIIAAGCYPQRSREPLEGMPEVDLVVGRDYPADLAKKLAEQWAGPGVEGPERGEALGPGDTPVRTRAMVKVQEGCDQVCAFCIVPKVRGRERSVHPEEIIGRIAGYVSAGFKEVVLTGTQLGSYGFDLPGIDLSALLRRVLAETGVRRLRVSSLQPQEIDPALLGLWEDPRLCPHFHLALQSGSDGVLKRMRRRYTARQYEETIVAIRSAVPGVSVTTDVIVGFPGETEGDFRATYALCDRAGFSSMHVFPYSARPGTSAARFDQSVDAAIKAGRMGELLALSRRHEAAYREALAGSTRQVLWEGSRGDGWSGLTDNYVRVAARSTRPLSNEITPARLLEREGEVLLAEVL